MEIHFCSNTYPYNVFYGIKIYKSATNYGGKLAWFIESVKNERSVKLERDNIYKYGVEGILKI